MKLTFALLVLFVSCAINVLAADTPEPAPATPATTNVVDAPPKALEAVFTNSADMVLLKVGDNWVGKYEVTQKEYQKIAGSNPSGFPGATRPVDSISWNDAMTFCQLMTDADTKKMKIPVGFYYTLPTEDEWQSWVADAKIEDSITSVDNPRDGTSPVGSLKPNSLGLFDIRGNVMEFTLGDDSKPYRVLLGASWQDRIEINLRPEFRFYTPPDDRKNTYGFRCLLKKH